MQLPVPAAAAKEPGAQLAHVFDVAAPARYWPAAHAVQAAAPDAAHAPAAHAAQDVDPAGLLVPAAQGVQDVAPAVALNEPAGQLAHNE